MSRRDQDNWSLKWFKSFLNDSAGIETPVRIVMPSLAERTRITQATREAFDEAIRVVQSRLKID